MTAPLPSLTPFILASFCRSFIPSVLPHPWSLDSSCFLLSVSLYHSLILFSSLVPYYIFLVTSFLNNFYCFLLLFVHSFYFSPDHLTLLSFCLFFLHRFPFLFSISLSLFLSLSLSLNLSLSRFWLLPSSTAFIFYSFCRSFFPSVFCSPDHLTFFCLSFSFIDFPLSSLSLLLLSVFYSFFSSPLFVTSSFIIHPSYSLHIFVLFIFRPLLFLFLDFPQLSYPSFYLTSSFYC